ncbi:MAG: NADH:ubiquinone oxidoreductase [Candidatus Thorarchaeota archaeon]
MSTEKDKPIVAFTGLTCCAGCQLEILNQEDELLDILDEINLVQFRMGSSATNPGPYDVCFIEGSVTNETELERLKEFREKSKILVAMGACATTGGINAIRNGKNTEALKQSIYGDASHIQTLPQILPMKSYVKIDYELQGCPINGEEFIELLTAILIGTRPVEKNYSVCVQCRINENVCIMKEGKLCLGPITRAGCGARCPSVNFPCEGCWGAVPQANVDSEIDMFSQKGASFDTVVRKFRMFNASEENFVKELKRRLDIEWL